MNLNSQFINLNKKIIACKKCKRLKNFREKIAKEKRKQYINEKYWGKPITGFGDLNSKIPLIVLPPTAHKENKTSRVFTKDSSAEFLYKCLYKAKMSNQSTSENKNDGLKLYNSYITTPLKCVPPGDKPTYLELKTSFNYFNKEIHLLKEFKKVIPLRKIAFHGSVKGYKENYF
jgi:Uracil-DNA glycosylase